MAFCSKTHWPVICRMILFPVAVLLATGISAAAGWQQVYYESFDRLAPGSRTASDELPNWEGNSAAGVVFDGKTEVAGRFLVAASAWTSFNQGPIFKLDLSATPHDRVRVRFDLYTLGDWRGLQRATGGPQHRLMFFDNKAKPAFAFDTSFSTNKRFAQSWPERNPAIRKALTGASAIEVDSTGRFPAAHRWPVEFEYPSDAPSLRFTMLCGAAAGSGARMPGFGIDNVQVLVRSTVPAIEPADLPKEIELASLSTPEARGSRLEFDVLREGRTSLGVFDKKSGRLLRTLLRGVSVAVGRHAISWDGLDDRGRPVAAGTYEWRAVTSPGFTAKYVTTLGINPPGGENPVPRRSWVGDHVGGGVVDVDEAGIYVGSPLTEGLMMLARVDWNPMRVRWTREQFYQSGRLTRAATSGAHVFMLHPNGKLRRLNRETGKVETEWQIAADGEAPGDVDAAGRNLVVANGLAGKIRWLSIDSGNELGSVSLPSPTSVAALEESEKGQAVAASANTLYLVQPGQTPRQVARLGGSIGAMDYDPNRKELWAVVNGHQVVRLNEQFRVDQTYSDKPRELGPFEPTRFAGVYDIAADLKGGFLVGEPGHPPRRIAHLARDGSLKDQWFGGMAFYVGGSFDPEDPTRFYGMAPEGAVSVYRIDYETGSWDIEATYLTGRLGDGMFPNAAAFRVVRRNNQVYLYHRVIPAVLRLDPVRREAVPVAIAGRVLNQGRTFFQYAGSGRGGYPRPWVAAAEHHGFQELAKAPGLYSWADSNGNGEFEPAEFRFYPEATRGLSFHNPGDFTENGDYLGSANINEPHALVRLPLSRWEGPGQAAPRWDWDRLETAGEILADSYGYGSPRGLSVGRDGSVSVAYQAGIMIRSHGQYEGGGWPESALRGARVLGFNARLEPIFSVGRQSKDARESSTGILYYPMQTTTGPHRSVIVNDQTKQPAQAWTHDGLYLGGLLDNRAADGREAGFYQVHGDDNQGASIVTTDDGRTYWLMPYQGHNRIYEISGWNGWERQQGKIVRPAVTDPKALQGSGLRARYYQGSKLLLETVEAPIYFERFGAEPHADKVSAHYKVIWTGYVAGPLGDHFQFRSLLGKAEQIAVWIDGQIVHANGFASKNVDKSVDLVGGHRHRIRVEYINPEGRAELNLLWSSTVLDPGRIPLQCLSADK